MLADKDKARGVPVSDAEALLGIVIGLEAFLIGDPAPELVALLSRRLKSAGLVGEGEGRPEVRLVLANLNQRLRYALGEYDDAPQPDIGLVDHDISFDSTATALRFADTIRGLGMRWRQEVPGDSGRVRVIVTTTDLLLSPGFDAARMQICAAAADCGGTYEGSGGPGSPDIT